MKLIQALVLSLTLALAPAASAAQYAFQPYGVASNAISATTSNLATAITLPSVPGRKPQARVYNAGTATVFILFGTSGVVATTTSIPVPSGAIEVYSLPDGTTHVGTITASGTATVYVTTGEGI